jgi:hypothetical protein
MKLLIRWAITSFALFVAAWIVPGVYRPNNARKARGFCVNGHRAYAG